MEVGFAKSGPSISDLLDCANEYLEFSFYLWREGCPSIVEDTVGDEEYECE